MLKAGSKRRRTQAEIKDDLFEKEHRDEALEEAIARNARMGRELEMAKHQAEKNENATLLLEQFA